MVCSLTAVSDLLHLDIFIPRPFLSLFFFCFFLNDRRPKRLIGEYKRLVSLICTSLPPLSYGNGPTLTGHYACLTVCLSYTLITSGVWTNSSTAYDAATEHAVDRYGVGDFL
jgi:hypothetical protein